MRKSRERWKKNDGRFECRYSGGILWQTYSIVKKQHANSNIVNPTTLESVESQANEEPSDPHIMMTTTTTTHKEGDEEDAQQSNKRHQKKARQ